MIKGDNKWLQIVAYGGEPTRKTVTFDGATTNDPGDFDGSGNPLVLFNVTGVVAMRLFAVVNTNMAGASATIQVGTQGSTAGLIALTTATNMVQGEIWHDNAPDAFVELYTVATEKIVTRNVIQTVATANITAGSLTYYCLWKAISPDGNVVAA